MQDTDGKDVLGVDIRAGHAGEAALLREMAIASKTHWGYDREWVQRWAEAGGFSREALLTRDIYVAEVGGEPVGWASVILKGEVCWLDDLWIEPAWIGKGIGSRLWRHAAGRALEHGAVRMEWEAEPNAIGFYEKMGGRYLRDSAEKEWGRVLPIMGVTLSVET
jgi:GNAT superfamily N-acetyltransferase